MTTYLTPVDEIDRQWFVVDAQGEVLGRLASKIATILRGKHKPNYSTFQDVGDFIVVINADKVRLTGNKLTDKVYYHHSGYIGGMKSITADKLMEKDPEQIIIKAVKGMLPKNTLGRAQLKKMKVYAGKDHPHEAQHPTELK